MKEPLSRFSMELGNGDRPAAAPPFRRDSAQPSCGPYAVEKGWADVSCEVYGQEVLSDPKGNNALIVCRDADAAAAASAIALGGFAATGLGGFSLQRAYVQISLFEQVLIKVIASAQELASGSRRDWSTARGRCDSEGEAPQVEDYIREAVQAGARLQAGGRKSGSLLLPTILTDVPARCRVIREEIVGPVVSILPFIEVQDAVYEASRPRNAKVSMLTRAMDSVRFERLEQSCSEV